MPEVGVPGAGRDDQVVVRDRFPIRDDRPRRVIEAAGLRQQHLHVGLPPQDPPNRRGDVGRRQRRGRHLIKQRLKQVVIVSIDDRDADGRRGERSRRVETAEPAADDDHMRRRHCHWRHIL